MEHPGLPAEPALRDAAPRHQGQERWRKQCDLGAAALVVAVHLIQDYLDVEWRLQGTLLSLI